jgi:crotonobetainyl-CoA:carnitine CoA-transferase CaiB-like acyl-CoA transferase
MSTASPGPLSGLRVVDLCHFLAGPYATYIMARLGADVVKVEDPGHPDEARSIGPFLPNGLSLYFASLNTGKRSLAVSFGTPEGRAVLAGLIRRSDVVVDNFRPGVLRRLGLHHEELDRLNPRIVSCSITGYGETGAYAEYPGYDYTIQAMAGVMSITGEPDGPPGKAGISYVDHSGGLAAALGVCAALLRRERTGRGEHIDLGLFDVQISMLTYLASWQLNAGLETQRIAGGAHPSLVPAQTFETADSYLSVFVGNDSMWRRLVAALGDDSLASQELATNAARQEHRTDVISRLQHLFRAQGVDHWLTVLRAANVACAPVNSLKAALDDDQVVTRGLVTTVPGGRGGDSYSLVSTPLPGMESRGGTRQAPLLGGSTDEVLGELGYTSAEIDRLRAGSAVI